MKIVKKFSNTKFHENRFSAIRVVPCGLTGTHDEAKPLFRNFYSPYSSYHTGILEQRNSTRAVLVINSSDTFRFTIIPLLNLCFRKSWNFVTAYVTSLKTGTEYRTCIDVTTYLTEGTTVAQ